MVTKSDIIAGLVALGVNSVSNLIVHSSLKSFGWVEHGAKDVVDALMELVTDGLLVMPSFNHGLPYESGNLFDIRDTPTTNGAIPEEFRKREHVFRSLNPTHSFALFGKQAESIARAHEHAETMGRGSPLDYLFQHSGNVLLLGVGYSRNTFHHYVETMEHSPCLYPRGEEYDVIDEKGRPKRVRTWSWRCRSCPIDDAAIYARLMKPYEKKELIGNCTATYFSMTDCYQVVQKALSEGLDDFPPCCSCATRPRVCEYTIEEYR